MDDVLIDRLLAVAKDIRRDYAEEHGVLPFPVTTRALIRVVRHLEMFPDDAAMLRSLFWRKMYWLDDQVHPAVARRLVDDLLDLHGIHDGERRHIERSRVAVSEKGSLPHLSIGTVTHPLGPGGPFVPDTCIEEVPQNLSDLEAILQDIVLGEHIMLIGEAGVGKNKLESYLAHLLNWNLLVIGMSGGTRVSDLLTYRSFGEEEEGKTGDTATLGLRALTDDRQKWIVVLDEANKAKQGVLVSLNDLLQDRTVRLPGGQEATVRATICVNINPNRPPYEVNDFSFEFMDRFSIHTIVHLPPDQAVEVLHAKYAEADIDFIRDIVNGYYALHPLYSGGILFEPITMRNEEAAIERGLQYPHQAINLVDLLCAGYAPRDARELNAIRNALVAGGFDRDVIPASSALAEFRCAWESDKNNESLARSLVDTYRRLGKPEAALGICREMLSRNPLRDWVFSFASAEIHLQTGKVRGAEEELQNAFPACREIRVDNDEEYRVLWADTEIKDQRPVIVLEAVNTKTGNAALIISERGGHCLPSLNRFSATFHLVFQDIGHGLCIYECDGKKTHPGSTAGPREDDAPLSHLVTEFIQRTGTGLGLSHLACTLPSPPWKSPVCRDGTVVRTLEAGGGTVTITASQRGDWSVAVAPSGQETGITRYGWMKDGKGRSGVFHASLPDGRVSERALPQDPFVHLFYREKDSQLTLVLSGTDHVPGELGRGAAGALSWRVVPLAAHHEDDLVPRAELLKSRLHEIIRYARPLSGAPQMGTGDVMYTILPDSRVRIMLVAETNGTRHQCVDLAAGSPFPSEVPGNDNRVLGIHRLYIPFSQLDTCEGRHKEARSPEAQAFLRDLRSYIASSLFARKRPRDIPFEVKARAILLGYRHFSEPIPAGSTILSRGDILVRTGVEGDVDRRSVFIVRFLHDLKRPGDQGPVMVRGFWLAEENPVGEEELAEVTGHFSRIAVTGDDRHARIIRDLISSCSRSAYPWRYSRTGMPADPVERFDLGVLSIEYRPVEHRFRLGITGDDGTPFFSLDETGYPEETVRINRGTSDTTSWKGTAIADISCVPEEGRVQVILEDGIMAFLEKNHILDDQPTTLAGQVNFEIVGQSGAQEYKVALNRRGP